MGLMAMMVWGLPNAVLRGCLCGVSRRMASLGTHVASSCRIRTICIDNVYSSSMNLALPLLSRSVVGLAQKCPGSSGVDVLVSEEMRKAFLKAADSVKYTDLLSTSEKKRRSEEMKPGVTEAESIAGDGTRGFKEQGTLHHEKDILLSSKLVAIETQRDISDLSISNDGNDNTNESHIVEKDTSEEYDPLPLKRLQSLNKPLGYMFTSDGQQLLRLSLGHASTATPDNRAIAWVGDAVLYLLITEDAIARFGLEHSTNDLNSIRKRTLSRECCAGMAKRLGMEKMIVVGNSLAFQSNNLPESILAEAFEAVLGAVYVDGGFDAARGFLDNAMLSSDYG